MTRVLLILCLFAGCAKPAPEVTAPVKPAEPIETLYVDYRPPKTVITRRIADRPSLALKSSPEWQRRQALVNDDSILARLDRIEATINRWERGKVSDADRARAKAMAKGDKDRIESTAHIGKLLKEDAK